ncbi:hypothetical protein ABZ543_13195 [Streptomyces roseifaciens]
MSVTAAVLQVLLIEYYIEAAPKDGKRTYSVTSAGREHYTAWARPEPAPSTI